MKRFGVWVCWEVCRDALRMGKAGRAPDERAAGDPAANAGI